MARGAFAEAEASYKAVVASDPLIADAWLQWAKLLERRGEVQEAAACLRLALTHLPRSIHILNDLALLLLSAGQTGAAGDHLERALEIAPQSAMLLCNLGIVRKNQGRTDDAIAAYRRAVAADPSIPEVHNNLGDALKEIDRVAAAEAFEASLRLRPNFAEALDGLGALLVVQDRLDEAVDKFSQALAAQPNFLRALGHKTTTLFLLGRLPEAWRLYRRRFEVEGIRTPPHGRFPTPVWNGEPLAGKALLVWTELGLGEEILQAGMFPDALDVASCLTVECSPRLETLFRRSFPSAAIIPRTNPARACPVPVSADLQIAGGDLGAAFRGDLTKFRRHSGYLVADPGKAAQFRSRYHKPPNRLVVGISWASGRSRFANEKSLTLAEFAPILRQQGVRFVNLQYAADPAEVAAVAAALEVDILTDETVDTSGEIDAIAAQVSAMDLVISVSNTTAHLAGALNVPVWNIVPQYGASGMWHWFADSRESAWYPSMRICRRSGKTSAKLMAGLAADLRAWTSKSLARSGS